MSCGIVNEVPPVSLASCRYDFGDMTSYSFTTPLWEYKGQGSWYFVSVPEDISDEIAEISAPLRRGFGSVKVDVTVGETSWSTSVFPDSKLKCYVLPVKKQVRVAESLHDGGLVEVELSLVFG